MKPAEVTQIHTRLLNCTLEVESSRAWFVHPSGDDEGAVANRAFAESWFGARSLPRVKALVTNLRARFDVYPHALPALRAWSHMDPATRALVCHWHVQLSDPVYRAFTSELLIERHQEGRPDITRDMVTRWVGDKGGGRWSMATRVQFASQLLATAKGAGLVTTTKDPRKLALPRVGDDALTYLMYLLRGIDFAGTLLANPYLASVGLTPSLTEDRVRALPAFRFRRQGGLVDFDWVYPDLEAWAEASLTAAHRGAV
jgi:hypothetical protein